MSRLKLVIAAGIAYGLATFGLYVLIGHFFGFIPELAAIGAGIAASVPLGRRLGRWAAAS